MMTLSPCKTRLAGNNPGFSLPYAYSNRPAASDIVRRNGVVRGGNFMSAKSLQTVSFLLLVTLTLYLAFGGGH